MVQHFVRHTV